MKEFNYKKIVVILSILLVIQIIVYAITNAVVSKDTGKEDNTVTNTTVAKTDEQQKEFYQKIDISYADRKEEILNPADFNHEYEKLKTVVSKTEVQKLLYKLVNEGFPTIYNAVSDKSNEEITNFYKTDYAKINSCGIMDEENYFYTAKELINQIYKGRNTYKSVKMDYESIQTNQNGYMTIDFTVYYSESAEIKMTAFLAEREGVSPRIKFKSNSDLKKLFEKCQGEVTPNDFTEKIKAFAGYLPKIKNKTNLESNNSRKRYYNKNAEDFKNIGIVSENDFMNLARAINNEGLVTDSFYTYKIRLDTVKEFDDRYELNVDLVFMSAQEFNLKVKIYKTKNADGRLIEFKSSLYNENYNDTNAE